MKFLDTRNGQAFPTARIPVVPAAEFRAFVTARAGDDARLVTFFGYADERSPGVHLLAVVAKDRESELALCMTDVGDAYDALTSDRVAASRFEREIAEQMGILPLGHSWLKPVRNHAPFGPGPYLLHDPYVEIGVDYPFFRMEGDEIHEVAVGPVHAGIIEPGHFRFQCYGEEVFHLEIMLGYQHRGIERALIGGPELRSLYQMEELAGDTTIGHTLAYCQALESLARCEVPLRAHALRALALELERLANHTGDIGALSGDVAFLPTAAYCGRIRGSFLNMTAVLCGNRFGRGFVVPGGVAYDLQDAQITQLQHELEQATTDVRTALDLFFENTSVVNRLEGTGPLSAQQCNDLGLVGPPARACGIARDVRHDHPFGMYRLAHIPTAAVDGGDVYARAMVRQLEIRRSTAFIRELLQGLPSGPTRVTCPPPEPGECTLSMVEGWRGEIAHVALTDSRGRFLRYKIVDPSFHNWPALEVAMRAQQISDFPLCNKSFNLSYSGHDL